MLAEDFFPLFFLSLWELHMCAGGVWWFAEKRIRWELMFVSTTLTRFGPTNLGVSAPLISMRCCYDVASNLYPISFATCLLCLLSSSLCSSGMYQCTGPI